MRKLKLAVLAGIAVPAAGAAPARAAGAAETEAAIVNCESAYTVIRF